MVQPNSSNHDAAKGAHPRSVRLLSAVGTIADLRSARAANRLVPLAWILDHAISQLGHSHRRGFAASPNYITPAAIGGHLLSLRLRMLGCRRLEAGFIDSRASYDGRPPSIKLEPLLIEGRRARQVSNVAFNADGTRVAAALVAAEAHTPWRFGIALGQGGPID